MDSAKRAIKEKIDSLPIEEGREFVATYPGSKDSEYQSFAVDCLAAKEAALRDSKDEESLSISKEANSIAREALNNSKRANIIAISAMILRASNRMRIMWH